MKTEIIKTDSSESKREFPLVAVSKGSGKTVLFTNKNTGVVIIAPEDYGSIDEVGYFSKNWTNCFIESIWTIPNTLDIRFDNTK